MVAVADVWFIEVALAPPACGILVAKTKKSRVACESTQYLGTISRRL